jgi:flagellin
MNELAVQGANDTNESIDREAINEELDALTDELDRISSTTQFNKQNLLDGTFTNKNLQVGANSNQKISISINSMNAESLGLKNASVVTSYDKQEGSLYTKFVYEGKSFAITSANAKKTAASLKAIVKAGMSGQVKAIYSAGNYAFVQGQGYKGRLTGKYYQTAGSAKSADNAKALSNFVDAVDNSFDKYALTSAVTADGPASYTVTGQNVNVNNYESANDAIDAIQEAINRVSTQRSGLGALQNRLEHTIANLDNVSENTQSAESRIRDTDMASEMVEYSKNNILAQAGQSMLAQSNQSTQGVLSLLQ